VPISSPEPTIEPAMISPGPSRARIPRIEIGGSSIVLGSGRAVAGVSLTGASYGKSCQMIQATP
jgi:hypothetical protein